MKSIVKSFIGSSIAVWIAVMKRFSIGRYVVGQLMYHLVSHTQTVTHRGVTLVFATPNALNTYRADTFSSKEPETLEWIDSLPEGSVFWDIGANVGLYTCYAAKSRGCRVYSFEPSVFNLEMLAKNIFLNGLTSRATIIPLPLAGELAVSTLHMSSTDWGGAMSTFGQTYGHDGELLHKVFEFSTIGLSMVDAVERLKISQPDYIKMDVDGIEHMILKGGAPILRKAKGVLVELNDQFIEQVSEASGYLRAAGMSLREKRHAACFDAATDSAKHTFNQIWTR